MLLRIVKGSFFSKVLLVANNVFSASGINVYIVGIFMYKYCNDIVPVTFDAFFQRNNELHSRSTRQLNDFHIRFIRIEVRKLSFRIHGATIRNDIPIHIKHTSSENVFKQMIRKHLHFSLNAWFLYVAQRKLQAKTRHIEVLGFGAPYIRDFTVIYIWQHHPPMLTITKQGFQRD